MFKSLFHSPPPLKDAILQTIHQLNVQYVKLEQVTFKLRKRDRNLFETCAIAIEEKNKDRAIVFANELVEVRNLLNIVVHAQLAIERVILRLETIRELSDIVVNLKPVLKTLQNVTGLLVRVMPKVALELEKVNDSISETLAITHIGTPQPVTPSERKTPQSEEILKEVSSFLERRLIEELPEPPASVIVPRRAEPAKKVRKMIALAAACSEAEVCEPRESQASLSYKDIQVQSVSFTVQRSSSLEDTLLEYAGRRKGKIDVAQCALELNLPYKDVMEALESLGARGKIKIGR